MKQDFYSYKFDNQRLEFEFESISQEKTIRKIIAYTPLSKNSDMYNLALGDFLDNGEVSDLTVSNNADMEKVIATVVQTIFIFFEQQPNSLIYLKGSTVERTRLYRIVISKELFEAQKLFDLYGELDNQFEVFVPNRSYQAFVIGLKLIK